MVRRNWWNSGQTLAGGGGCAQLFGGLELSHQDVPISFTRGPDNWSKYGDTGSRHLLYFYGNCTPNIEGFSGSFDEALLKHRTRKENLNAPTPGLHVSFRGYPLQKLFTESNIAPFFSSALHTAILFLP